MSKKTISVAWLLEKANHMLEKSNPEMIQGRESMAVFISSVLSESDNYKGFCYLNPAADNSGFYGKECRVFFYVAEKLKEEYKKYSDIRAAGDIP